MQSPDGAAVAGPVGMVPAGGEITAARPARRNLFLDDFLHNKRAMGGCASWCCSSCSASSGR